jgi:hypothetical protein
MEISVIDRSNYFRGLLLLISIDHIISEPEIILMKRIGKTLGFEKDFCNDAINEILKNKFILKEPPKFSTNEIAKKFIKDGLFLANSDNENHPDEEIWLESIAEKNGIDTDWFILEKKNAANRKGRTEDFLEIDDLIIEYPKINTNTQ